jgi:hypothetical protein
MIIMLVFLQTFSFWLPACKKKLMFQHWRQSFFFGAKNCQNVKTKNKNKKGIFFIIVFFLKVSQNFVIIGLWLWNGKFFKTKFIII